MVFWCKKKRLETFTNDIIFKKHVLGMCLHWYNFTKIVQIRVYLQWDGHCCLEQEKNCLYHPIWLFLISWMLVDVKSVFVCVNNCCIHWKIICKDVTLFYFGCNMSFCGSTKIVTVVAVVCYFSNLFRSMQIISACLSHIKNWVEKVVLWRFERVLTTSDKNWKLVPLLCSIIVMKSKNLNTIA